MEQKKDKGKPQINIIEAESKEDANLNNNNVQNNILFFQQLANNQPRVYKFFTQIMFQASDNIDQKIKAIIQEPAKSVNELRNIFSKKPVQPCKYNQLIESIESNVKLSALQHKNNDIMRDSISSQNAEESGAKQVKNLVEIYQNMINTNQQRTKEEQEIWDRLQKNKHLSNDKRSLEEQFQDALRQRQESEFVQRSTEVHKLQTLEFLQNSIRHSYNNNFGSGYMGERTSITSDGIYNGVKKGSRKLNMDEVLLHEKQEQFKVQREKFQEAFNQIYEEYEIEWVKNEQKLLFQSLIQDLIEDRLDELSLEIVEQEQSSALRKVLEECIQQISFEVALPQVQDDFIEKFLSMEVNSLAFGCLEHEQTLHTVDQITEENFEATLNSMIKEITENNIRFETELVRDTEGISAQLIDAEISGIVSNSVQSDQLFKRFHSNMMLQTVADFLQEIAIHSIQQEYLKDKIIKQTIAGMVDDQIRNLLESSFMQLQEEKYLQEKILEDIYVEIIQQQLQNIASAAFITIKIQNKLDNQQKLKQQEELKQQEILNQQLSQIKVPIQKIAITPQKSDEDFFYDQQNLQSLQRKSYMQRESANYIIRKTINGSKSPLRGSEHSQNSSSQSSANQNINIQFQSPSTSFEQQKKIEFGLMNSKSNGQIIRKPLTGQNSNMKSQQQLPQIERPQAQLGGFSSQIPSNSQESQMMMLKQQQQKEQQFNSGMSALNFGNLIQRNQQRTLNMPIQQQQVNSQRYQQEDQLGRQIQQQNQQYKMQNFETEFRQDTNDLSYRQTSNYNMQRQKWKLNDNNSEFNDSEIMRSHDKSSLELKLLQDKDRKLIEQEKLKERLRQKLKAMDWNDSDNEEQKSTQLRIPQLLSKEQQNKKTPFQK
ncbi:UNKNOWN [Stylonychia lemnae]|uniref:Uncharacterized protein n=1 Tax=Stylonychia lemnae TaxID=5949 RepID=A0A078BEU6_STYLE|nr:UNKNOWN [Stylonychia lemnae]|eukprot:CDW91687.1 UNKNOWN [Stylonychia lemnae]